MTTTVVRAPVVEDLCNFMGWFDLDEEQQATARAHLLRAVHLVHAYTRGRGWTGDFLAPAVAQIVVSVAARTMTNPTSAVRVEAGAYSSVPGQPDFTLQERLVLDGWRRRAA
ncbi:hypothetical protein [Microlunatus flavus]|uniref:Phage gp6-like head-tail connector protein n=1 Tax=Microlunatus flavus TaxID=1036181 RepID=A0A1H9LKX5_9ACTN|nr:hypothetical protein [Microlunatus flavus]SER12018.1 hypothetical protein SAMN05421756_1092 [Microlunatus flavus]